MYSIPFLLSMSKIKQGVQCSICLLCLIMLQSKKKKNTADPDISASKSMKFHLNDLYLFAATYHGPKIRKNL